MPVIGLTSCGRIQTGIKSGDGRKVQTWPMSGRYKKVSLMKLSRYCLVRQLQLIWYKYFGDGFYLHYFDVDGYRVYASPDPLFVRIGRDRCDDTVAGVKYTIFTFSIDNIASLSGSDTNIEHAFV